MLILANWLLFSRVKLSSSLMKVALDVAKSSSSSSLAQQDELSATKLVTLQRKPRIAVMSIRFASISGGACSLCTASMFSQTSRPHIKKILQNAPMISDR